MEVTLAPQDQQNFEGHYHIRYVDVQRTQRMFVNTSETRHQFTTMASFDDVSSSKVY
jgi:hypothetical protein